MTAGEQAPSPRPSPARGEGGREEGEEPFLIRTPLICTLPSGIRHPPFVILNEVKNLAFRCQGDGHNGGRMLDSR